MAKRKTTPIKKALKQPRGGIEKLRDYALSMPGAVEDHPWGETVAKVGGKVFVFLGHPDSPHGPQFTVKLPTSHSAALKLGYCEPAGYGMGKHNWVSVRVVSGAKAMGQFERWIDESYRAVAPKRLLAQLEEPR